MHARKIMIGARRVFLDADCNFREAANGASAPGHFETERPAKPRTIDMFARSPLAPSSTSNPVRWKRRTRA